MQDKMIEDIDRQISALQVRREERLETALDPKRREIRAEYEKIQSALDRLHELGEDVADVEDYALHIRGKSFEIDPVNGVQEV